MLSINPSELIWTILCFLALLFLLNRFLYQPLVRFMDERKAYIDAGLQEEAEARAALDEDSRLLEQERQETLARTAEELRADKKKNEEQRSAAVLEAKQRAAEAAQMGRAETVALYTETDEELGRRREELGVSLARRLLRAGNTEQQ